MSELSLDELQAAVDVMTEALLDEYARPTPAERSALHKLEEELQMRRAADKDALLKEVLLTTSSSQSRK